MNEISKATLQNCWKHILILPQTLLVNDDVSMIIDNDYKLHEDDYVKQLQNSLDSLCNTANLRNRPLDLMRVDEYIQVDITDPEHSDLETIVALLLEDDSSNVDAVEVVEEKIIERQAYSSILNLERYCMENGEIIPHEVRSFIERVKFELSIHISKSKKQMSIDDYFVMFMMQPKANV